MIVQTKTSHLDSSTYLLRAKNVCGISDNEGTMDCSLPRRHKGKHGWWRNHNMLLGDKVEFEGRCNISAHGGTLNCSLQQCHEGDDHHAYANHDPEFGELLGVFKAPCLDPSNSGQGFVCTLDENHMGRHEIWSRSYRDEGYLRGFWTCAEDFQYSEEELEKRAKVGTMRPPRVTYYRHLDRQ